MIGYKRLDIRKNNLDNTLHQTRVKVYRNNVVPSPVYVRLSRTLHAMR